MRRQANRSSAASADETVKVRTHGLKDTPLLLVLLLERVLLTLDDAQLLADLGLELCHTIALLRYFESIVASQCLNFLETLTLHYNLGALPRLNLLELSYAIAETLLELIITLTDNLPVFFLIFQSIHVELELIDLHGEEFFKDLEFLGGLCKCPGCYI